MNCKLIIRAKAEQDLAEAYAWYESKADGLGADFLRRAEAVFQHLCRHPYAGTKCYREYRRSLLRRFPYGVFTT